MNSWFIEVSYFSLSRLISFFIVPPMPPKSQKSKTDLKVWTQEHLERAMADNDARARDFGDETTLQSETKKRGRGRPPLPPGEGKRFPVGCRVTEETRDWLNREAARSVRSVAQQMEHIFERAAGNVTWGQRDFGDETTYQMMRALATAKKMAELSTGKSAYEDPETTQLALTAMKRVLAALFVVLPCWQADKND